MTEPVLAITGLCKSFGALHVSKDVALSLYPGEIHALIGPNGAGKSTLIAQIAGSIRPDAGVIHLAGRDVTGLSTAARAKLGLARTFQISALALEDTVLQNALLGALGARGGLGLFRPVLAEGGLRVKAEAALHRTGLGDQMTTRAGDLSHGQRRQLEVAVALTLTPRAFVMDEPMAGLGTNGTTDLTRLLDGLRAEAPILMVEHDMEAVFALADRISVLVYGRIIATGTTAQIRANKEVQRAYLGQGDA